MEYIVKGNDTASIQKMIDFAAENGGGKVVLPPGIYEGATFFLKSNIHLHIENGAVLKGVPDYRLYTDFRHPGLDAVTPENSRTCFIGASECENITISGNGIIDGNGEGFFDPATPPESVYRKPPFARPRMLQLYKCRNVHIEGVTFYNSPNWTMWLADSEDIHISGIRIHTMRRIPNGDGIDMDCCKRVTVSDSFFDTSDDCLILRAIRKDKSTPAICEHIHVTNCVLSSRCQGIRMGCPSDDTIRHCSFSNIIFRGGGSGIHCESPYRYLRKDCTGCMHISDIAFHNFDIESGRYPVRIGCEGAIALRGIERISFTNFRIKAKAPIYLEGNANTILKEISFNNISGTIEGDCPLHARYVQNLQLNNFDLTAVTGEAPEFRREDSPSWETKF